MTRRLKDDFPEGPLESKGDDEPDLPRPRREIIDYGKPLPPPPQEEAQADSEKNHYTSLPEIQQNNIPETEKPQAIPKKIKPEKKEKIKPSKAPKKENLEKKAEEKQKHPKKGFLPLLWKLTKIGAYTALGGIAVAGAGAFIYYQSIKGDLPDPKKIESVRQGVVTRVYSSDNVLLKDFAYENRDMVSFDKIPKYLVKALIATEDAQFYSHNGINMRGVISAIKSRGKRGGSSITQQLAKNLFVGRKHSIDRKIKEAITALRIEKVFSKDKILEMYLNQIYLGNGVYGVKRAAEKYFDKPLEELDANECALFVGMVKAPEAYRPDKYPEKAQKRKNLVLWRMFDDRVKLFDDQIFTKAQYDSLKKIKIVTNMQEKSCVGDYFVEEVRQQLSPKPISFEDFYSRGYNIFTTLNYEYQKAAEDALKTFIAEKQKKSKKNDLQAALIGIDNYSGAIVALVGGVDFSKSKFDRAIQAKRGPGSSFKPIVFAAALDNGYSIDSKLIDIPFAQIDDLGKIWAPENYEGEGYVGEVTMNEVCAESRNIPTILLAQDIGLENVINYARMLGITTSLPAYAPLAIGACEVKPIEMAAAYSVFANGGIYREPYMIERVTLRETKEPIITHSSKERLVISPSVAANVVKLLENVIKEGTGQSARSVYKIDFPIAGKTGTTNDCTDGWFIGFCKDQTVGVWVGKDDHSSMGKNETGASTALKIWAKYIKEIYKDKQVGDFWFKMNNSYLADSSQNL